MTCVKYYKNSSNDIINNNIKTKIVATSVIPTFFIKYKYVLFKITEEIKC